MSDYRVEVLNELADLSRVIEILDGVWSGHNLDADLQADLNIAIEEILSNAIRHGGGGEPIQLRVSIDAEDIRVEIQDQGAAFDPLQHPPPDLDLPLEQRRAGGLGIFMTVKLMDRTHYVRREGWNCFTMQKARRHRVS